MGKHGVGLVHAGRRSLVLALRSVQQPGDGSRGQGVERSGGHGRIDRADCVANPHGHKGYGASCWGLTASDDPGGYLAHAPDNDNGTISPTAALASLPYVPGEVMRALRYFLTQFGERIWGRYGFVDAFCERKDWFADTWLAIDQGPLVVMMENHPSCLLWQFFMSVPPVQI